MSNTRTRDASDEVTHQDELRDELREARKEVARIEREIVAESTPVNGGVAITPELDYEGGTVYRVGEDTYDTPEEAAEAAAPPEAEAQDEDRRTKRTLRRGGSDDE